MINFKQIEMEDTIYFYEPAVGRVKEEDIYLNNYSTSPFIDPATKESYQSVEHYYQSQKFLHDEEIR